MFGNGHAEEIRAVWLQPSEGTVFPEWANGDSGWDFRKTTGFLLSELFTSPSLASLTSFGAVGLWFGWCGAPSCAVARSGTAGSLFPVERGGFG